MVGFTPPSSDARTGAGGFAVVGGGEGIVVWILKAAWVRGFLVVGGGGVREWGDFERCEDFRMLDSGARGSIFVS